MRTADERMITLTYAMRGACATTEDLTAVREDVLVRTDAASVEQCLAVCLPRLRELGFSFPA
ncbi:hypothetical protein ACFWMT_19675 [Streptomyces sp. NPDC058368]|uniref:hypothetical protein n=1 Tax=Streptomyces sp. NPDC058368 TaxID=3346461 RepID=UPI0036691BB4